MSDLEDRLSRALAARAETVQPADLRPASVPAVITPLRRWAPVAGVSVVAVAAAVAVFVAVVGIHGPRSADPGPAVSPTVIDSSTPPPTSSVGPTSSSRPTSGSTDGSAVSSPHGWRRGNLPAIFPLDEPGTVAQNTSYTFSDGTVARMVVRGGGAVEKLRITPPGEPAQSIDIPTGGGDADVLALEKVQLDVGPSTVAAYPRDSMAYVVLRRAAGGEADRFLLVSTGGSLQVARLLAGDDVPFADTRSNGRVFTTYLSQDAKFYTLAAPERGDTSQRYRKRAWEWTVSQSVNTGGQGPTISARPLGTICADVETGEFGRCS